MPYSTEQSTAKATELANILTSATDCVNRLLALLEEEREALSTGDIESIDRCGSNKADCVVLLERLDSERAQLCRELSLENDEIDEFLNDHEGKPSDNLWKNFLVQLETCKETNSVNGSFTRIRRGHIEKALRILRGSDSAPALYGPNGLDENNGVNHLGQA
ncbi:MAG: flagella synthesis protein FlgN [Gammaproteobacteria bacterium]